MGLANLLEADTISNPFTSVHTLGMAAVLDTCSREMRGLPRPGRLRPGGHHCRSQWTLKHYFGVGLIMRMRGSVGEGVHCGSKVSSRRHTHTC